MDMRKLMMMRRDDEPRRDVDRPEDHYPPYYGVEDRYRDRRGREHYDNGRYAPQNRSSGTLTWDSREPDREGKLDIIGFEDRSDGEYGNLRMIRGAERGEKLDVDTVRDWMERLRNDDGTTGPHWTMEQTSQVMRQKGVGCDPLEFRAAMNMMYSDYSSVAKKANANNIDFYVNMAKAFLDDEDARGGKLARYYEAVVE